MKNVTISFKATAIFSFAQYWAAILFSALLLTNCKKEAPLDLKYLEYGNYLKSFNEEAKKRGLDFEDELRKIKFEPVEGLLEAQDCSANLLMIPEEYSYSLLKKSKTFYVEQFIFHALGHCLLGREHDNAKLPNGEWKSIMRDEPFWGGAGEAIDFNGAKRDYYIAELFDPNANSNDYFDNQKMEFETPLHKELIIQTGCHAENSIYEEIAGDYEIVVQLAADENPSYINIAVEGDSSSLYLFYDSSRPRILLQNISDYGAYISYDLPAGGSPPTASATFTIRKVGNVASFFLDGHYLFHRPDHSRKLLNCEAHLVEPCLFVSTYKLTI